MPIAVYGGEVVVSASGPDVCFVRFACVCSLVGLTEAEWRGTWTTMQIRPSGGGAQTSELQFMGSAYTAFVSSQQVAASRLFHRPSP